MGPEQSVISGQRKVIPGPWGRWVAARQDAEGVQAAVEALQGFFHELHRVHGAGLEGRLQVHYCGEREKGGVW